MQVHFELFIRRNAAASWSLEMASEDRKLIIETADLLLAEKRAVAVRVMKETLDPATGEYKSVTLTTKGDLANVKAKPTAEVQQGPLCGSPSDLYTVHAREQIGRLLDEWLRRKCVTPFELLHRGDLAEQLDASGMELQHAIQKISIPEAQARGVSTHEVMRHYQKLAEQVVEKLVRDSRRRCFPNLAERGSDAVVARLSGVADGAYLLAGGVAAHLKPGRTWGAKVDLLLDLAQATAADNRAFVFGVLTQPLSEILGSRGGLADIADGELDLGDSLALLTRLVASDEVGRMIGIEPALERQFPPLTSRIARLSGWLRDAAFADVRAALAHRILSELNGPRRLRAGDPQGEILILRALAMVMTAFAGHVLAPDEVQIAFTERSRALVASDFVTAYVADAPTALAEVQSLVRLAENVVGGVNKRSAAKWILAATGALRFERELRSAAEGPGAKLASLADLQQALNRISLPEADKTMIAAKIGDIGGLIEADANYSALVSRAPAPALDRLNRLLSLASGETAPMGPAAARARIEVEKLLRTPGVRGELAGAPQTVERIRRMMGMALAS